MARLDREATCAGQIILGRGGPELEIHIRLPKVQVEASGLRMVIFDDEVTLRDEVTFEGVGVSPRMKLHIVAEVPEHLHKLVRHRRALRAARGKAVLV